MPKTFVASKESIEFIIELADRFPDLPDHEVLLAYSEYKRTAPVEFDTIKAHVILFAYNNKDLKLTDDYARTVYGVFLA